MERQSAKAEIEARAAGGRGEDLLATTEGKNKQGLTAWGLKDGGGEHSIGGRDKKVEESGPIPRVTNSAWTSVGSGGKNKNSHRSINNDAT
ncbi:hypothetical protein KI387_031435, partial [Taxus chinensis]